MLTDDERELGVCLVDIGAGTTDIAIFTQGALRHTTSLAIGGDQVTSDIAHLMRTPTAHAEELKVRYACALAQLAHAEETIQVPSVGDRPPRRLARQNLAEAVQPRYEEIFEMVQADLRRSGREELVRAGIVLTGGAARMEGALDLAEELFHMPVRLGMPQHVTGLADVVANPIHATGVGLVDLRQSSRRRAQRAGGRRVGGERALGPGEYLVQGRVLSFSPLPYAGEGWGEGRTCEELPSSGLRPPSPASGRREKVRKREKKARTAAHGARRGRPKRSQVRSTPASPDEAGPGRSRIRERQNQQCNLRRMGKCSN